MKPGPPSTSPLSASLIAIEGCVGAGKTTVAAGLGRFRGARLLLEDFSAVPFLEEFYADPSGCALETEFSFLLQHYHQLRIAARESGEIVADFAIDKDLIFAQLNMPDLAERSAFEELHRLLSARVLMPTITVFLSSSDELILQRIKARGRPFELAAPQEYYRGLNAGYEAFFAGQAARVIHVSADEMDFCANPDLYTWLSTEIDRRRESNVDLGLERTSS